MARRGSFTGGGSLDPFGGSRGGLGRYNITGDTIQSLASFETYAVQVAWANGTATDEQYLAQLQKMVDLATPGTRQYVTATNELHDARYSIGRNSLVRNVNDATTHGDRQQALTSLLTFEQSHLSDMTATDSQAYRQQLDRVASVRGELRQDRYTALLEDVNRGKATTQQLRDLAVALGNESRAAGDPDVDEWGQTIDSLNQRMKDEATAKAYQSYQHHKMTGDDLLALLDSQLATMSPGSPAYDQLARSREDLATQVTSQKRSLEDANIQAKRDAGTLSDADFLKYLRDSYAQTDPGTSEWIAAGNRLSNYTFSLAEDKLRYDVQTGKRPVGDLVSFYQSYLQTMNPGSEKYRTVAGAIYSLTHGSGRGGSGAMLLKGIGPLVDPAGALADLMGGKTAPPGFADLFRVNPNNAGAFHWWENNRSSMTKAFESGAATWTYYAPNGAAYNLPFNPGMMSEFDNLHLKYTQIGLAGANTLSEAQTWVGRIMTGTSAQQSHGQRYATDSFSKAWDALETQKGKLLASGRIADYFNIVQLEVATAKTALASPFMTSDTRDSINSKLAKIAPYDPDPQSPYYNLNGDHILTAIGTPDGGIRAHLEKDPVSGLMIATEAVIDPQKAFLTQGEGGTVTYSEVGPNDYRAAPDPTDPTKDVQRPTYMDESVPIEVVDPFGGRLTVWQPINRPGTTAKGTAGPIAAGALPVYAAGTFYGSGGANQPVGTAVMPQRLVDPRGKNATIPVYSVTVWERPDRSRNGAMVATTWVTLTDPAGDHAGSTWVKLQPGGVLPRVVLPSTVTMDANGNWSINGKTGVTVHDVLAAGARFWGEGDSHLPADYGAPGTSFEQRKTSSTGTLDLGVPEWQLNQEELARFNTNARRGTGPAREPLAPSADTRAESFRINTAAGSPLSFDTRSESQYRRGGLNPISTIPSGRLPQYGLPPIANAPLPQMPTATLAGKAIDDTTPLMPTPKVALNPIATPAPTALQPISKVALAPIVLPGKAADDLVLPAPLPVPPPPKTGGGGGGAAAPKML